MYDDYFKYPGEWTQDWDSYIKNKDKLVEKIHWVMNDYKKHLSKIDVLTNYLSNEYFSCINIIRMLQYYNEQNKETSTS